MKIYQLYINGHILATTNSLDETAKIAAKNFQTPPIKEWQHVNQDRWETGGGYSIHEEVVQFAESPGITWQHEGNIFFDTDTANVMLFFRGKRRLLVVPEWQELMQPTQPCVQLNFQRIFRRIFEKEAIEESLEQESFGRTPVQKAPPVIPLVPANDGKTLF